MKKSTIQNILLPRKGTVLLVDADGDSKAIVSEAAPRTGRDLIVVATSPDAFKVLDDQMGRLDAVIVDVDPGAHSLALLEAITSCGDKPPIVVVTALEETYMNPIAMEHGAMACLGKPITIQKLSATLDAVSGHSRTCDRWGHLISSTVNSEMDVRGQFSGIAAKLCPSGFARACGQ